MAAIISTPLSKSSKGFHPVKIDMTPMVDLGFLLITFFVFTASLTQPTVAKLSMPKADSTGEQTVYEKTLLTVILGQGKVLVYEGAFAKAAAGAAVRQTDYNAKTGLGEAVRQKQRSLQADGLKDDLTVVIKPSPAASYGEVMNALDEMMINGVTRYIVVDASPKEKRYLAEKRF